jgi:uncharacterized alkaline shock family protein YloU
MSKVIITDDAIESIILNATLSVEGVADTWRGIEEYIPYLNKDKKHTHGIDFVLENGIVSANVFVIAKYDFDLRKLGKEIQQNVKSQVESMTPFKVGTINVVIEDIAYEG